MKILNLLLDILLFLGCCVAFIGLFLLSRFYDPYSEFSSVGDKPNGEKKK